jgi:hypothetical protein
VNTTGFCECGCGGKTSIAKQTSRRFGHVQGEPVRFIIGHGRRGRKPGNWKGGPYLNDGGYVVMAKGERKILEHRVIVEKALGKPLPYGAVVHHHGGNRSDNGKDLVLCQNQDYHMLLHVRTRALEDCGNANYRKCPFCKKYGDPAKMILRPAGGRPHHCHDDCRKSYDSSYNKTRRRAECQLRA